MFGRLNHADYIIPHSRYFLNRLRYRLKIALKFGPQELNKAEKKDLIFLQKILQNISIDGIPIENISHSNSTIVCWSDACEHGFEGYTNEGLAWRWAIPKIHYNKFSIYLLEFLASSITIQLALRSKPKCERILAFTDSSNALG